MAEINEHMKPWTITREELDLRFAYMHGGMTLEEFNKRFEELKKQGLIKRDGKVIR